MSDELSPRAQAVIDHTLKIQLPLLMDSLTWFREEEDGPITTKEVADTILRYAFHAFEFGSAGFPKEPS